MPYSGYPTPDEQDGDVTYGCIPVIVPNNPEFGDVFAAAIYGLYGQMANDWFWKQQGTLSPQLAALYSSQALALTEAYGDCMACEDIADCIETNETTQSALQTFMNNNGYGSGSGTPSTDSVYQQNPRILDGSLIAWCDNDNLFGGITQMIAFINARIVDFIEQAEVLSNTIERTQLAIQAIPIVNELPFDELVAFTDQIFEELAEGYVAAYTVDWVDEVRCDLFCLVKDTCELDFQTFADYFYSRIGETRVDEAFVEAIQWLLTGTFTGEQIADAFFGLVCSALAYGSRVFGINIGGLATSLTAAMNDPDSDWTILCDECAPSLFEPVITHNDPCAVAVSSSGSIVGEQSAGVWRMSSSSYVEAGTQGISFADVDGRLFEITNAVKVSGADIFSWTVADNECDTSNGFGTGYGGLDIKNIVIISEGNAPFTYDFTIVLL